MNCAKFMDDVRRYFFDPKTKTSWGKNEVAKELQRLEILALRESVEPTNDFDLVKEAQKSV